MAEAKLYGLFNLQWHYALGGYVAYQTIYNWFNDHRRGIDSDLEFALIFLL